MPKPKPTPLPKPTPQKPLPIRGGLPHDYGAVLRRIDDADAQCRQHMLNNGATIDLAHIRTRLDDARLRLATCRFDGSDPSVVLAIVAAALSSLACLASIRGVSPFTPMTCGALS